MSRDEVIYLVPYLASLLLSAGVFLFSLRHRRIPGGAAFAFFVGGQTLYILGFILELISQDIGIKLFWDRFMWLTNSIAIAAFPIFAIQLADLRLRNPGPAVAAFVSIPVVFALAVLTDGIHHGIYASPHLQQAYPFNDLEYSYTTAVYIYGFYAYTVALAGIGLMLSRLFRPQRLFRSQLIAVAIGLLIPMIGSVLALLDVRIAPQRNITPFTFALGSLIVAWGLFRSNLFEVVPVARDTVVDNMGDPVIVVDLKNRIIDLNPATAQSLGITYSEAIGRPAGEVFAEWDALTRLFTGTLDLRTDVTMRIDGRTHQYELHISPLRDRRKRTLGRVFVLNDVTERVILQSRLEDLNQDLERRVEERTQELAAAYDTTLEGWARALEFRDKETEGHSRRVTELTLKMARILGIPDAELNNIRRGAILHDIGKMSIPDEILRKAGPLTDEERQIIRRHPDIARELLGPIRFLAGALEIPYCHHEKWDGTGYPQGLRGEAIPLSARVFAVADVWDAIQSDRSYKERWPRQKASDYMRDQAGTHFDPRVVEVFLGMLERGEI